MYEEINEEINEEYNMIKFGNDISPLQTHGDQFVDDGITFNVWNEDDTQLEIRVGPTFYAENTPEEHPEKAVWLDVTNGDVFETLILSKTTFAALVEYVNKKFVTWEEYEKTKEVVSA